MGLFHQWNSWDTWQVYGMLSFTRTCKAVFQTGCTITYNHQHRVEILLGLILYWHLIFPCNHSNRCIVASHCKLNVDHLPMCLLFAICPCCFLKMDFIYFLIGLFVFLFDYCVLRVFIYSRQQSLVEYVVCKYFLLLCCWAFHPLNEILLKSKKVFNFQSNSSASLFIDCMFISSVRRLCLHLDPKYLLLLLFSFFFIVFFLILFTELGCTPMWAPIRLGRVRYGERQVA